MLPLAFFSFPKDEAVIMSGNFADLAGEGLDKWGKINRAARWHKPWFYKHVETFLDKASCAQIRIF